MSLSSLKAHLITFFKTRLIKLYLNSELMTDPTCLSQVKDKRYREMFDDRPRPWIHFVGRFDQDQNAHTCSLILLFSLCCSIITFKFIK